MSMVNPSSAAPVNPIAKNSPSKEKLPLVIAAGGLGSLGLAEFHTLLNQIPEASLIYDRKRDMILAGNSALLTLTAFSTSEIIGETAANLFEDGGVLAVSNGGEVAVGLRRRKREAIPVSVRVSALGTNEHIYLVNVIPHQAGGQTQQQWNKAINQGYLELNRLQECANLELAFQQGLDIARRLLGTEMVCIYQVPGKQPLLQRTSSGGGNELFPETLPSGELQRMGKVSLWTPGKRVISEVQKIGRLNNLSYIASAPLGQPGAFFGMLVAAGSTETPSETHLHLLEYMSGVFSNLHQHYMLVKNVKRELKQQELQLDIREMAFANVQEAVFVIQPDMKILEINPAAEAIFGYANSEVRDQAIEKILIGNDDLMRAIEVARMGTTTHNLNNLFLHRRDGKLFPVQAQVVPVQKAGVLLGILLFLRDSTEVEEIRYRTQQLEHRATLGDFSAVFAHDVRNPINNISTGVQLMASRLAADDPNQEVISRVQGDCTRLIHLMESVLTFSRPLETKFEPVDIAQMLKQMTERWQMRFMRANMSVFFQVEDNLPRILADPRALEQVFSNLFTNAIDAMSKTGGKLSIKLTTTQNAVRLRFVDVAVTDTGPGIPDDIRQKIFEPFVTNKPKGTGLGLAISKRIITAHRGNITVDSFPGGTVFHVMLPVIDGE